MKPCDVVFSQKHVLAFLTMPRVSATHLFSYIKFPLENALNPCP